MSTKEQYTQMLKTYYENETSTMKKANHSQHNSNPDYWNILLSPLKTGDWSKKKVLDFACGCGRNVLNILENFEVKEAHGCDISQANIDYCNEYLKSMGKENYKFYCNEGTSLQPCKDSKYHMIVSTIALQHICSYDIRYSILKDMYRCLKKNGVLSFQMGFGTGHSNTADYYDNHYTATKTNGGHDVRVTDENFIIKDLEEIGFKEIKTTVTKSWMDNHKQWIYVSAVK